MSMHNIMTSLKFLHGLNLSHLNRKQTALLLDIIPEVLLDVRDHWQAKVDSLTPQPEEIDAQLDESDVEEDDVDTMNGDLAPMLSDDMSIAPTYASGATGVASFAQAAFAPRLERSAIEKAIIGAQAPARTAPPPPVGPLQPGQITLPYTSRGELTRGCKQNEKRYLVVHYPESVSFVAILDRLNKDVPLTTSYKLAKDPQRGEIVALIRYSARRRNSGPTSYEVSGTAPRLYHVSTTDLKSVDSYLSKLPLLGAFPTE